MDNKFIEISAKNAVSEIGVEVLRMGANIAAFKILENQNVPVSDASKFRNLSSGDSFVGVEDGIILKSRTTGKEIILNGALEVVPTKNIVKTAINGLRGTIKEWISDGDFEITLSAILGGEKDIYPFDEFKELRAFLKENESLIIYSKILNEIYEVTRVVVQGSPVTHTTWSNLQEVKIDLLSDTNFLIEEKINA